MRRAGDLDWGALRSLAQGIIDTMYLDIDENDQKFYNPDKSWDGGIIEEVADHLSRHNLVPKTRVNA